MLRHDLCGRDVLSIDQRNHVERTLSIWDQTRPSDWRFPLRAICFPNVLIPLNNSVNKKELLMHEFFVLPQARESSNFCRTLGGRSKKKKAFHVPKQRNCPQTWKIFPRREKMSSSSVWKTWKSFIILNYKLILIYL